MLFDPCGGTTRSPSSIDARRPASQVCAPDILLYCGRGRGAARPVWHLVLLFSRACVGHCLYVLGLTTVFVWRVVNLVNEFKRRRWQSHPPFAHHERGRAQPLSHIEVRKPMGAGSGPGDTGISGRHALQHAHRGLTSVALSDAEALPLCR